MHPSTLMLFLVMKSCLELKWRLYRPLKKHLNLCHSLFCTSCSPERHESKTPSYNLVTESTIKERIQCSFVNKV